MAISIKALADALNGHQDPLVRWKLANQALATKPPIPQDKSTKQLLGESEIVRQLLLDQNSEGQIAFHPYNKWFGAHWILSILADMHYPAGDPALEPLLEQCYAWLLSKEHARQILTINSRVRRCASQEGNCIYYSLALQLADGRTEELAARLIRWQWDDGGWNCDKRPEANKSSFHESLIPLRGLAWYASISGDPKARQAVERAAEVFLKRHLFKKVSDGKIIDQNFIAMHYPSYWHYDILSGLKAMAEAGFIDDPRCSEALDLLESKRLPDGGYPAEARYYRVDDKKLSGHSRVNWGGTSKVRMNPFVSLDVLAVLKAAGRTEA
ncbi:MAG: hypothetical protein C3F13_11300 [Anaerolineales bacterium]|nr:hypothetical protein [Anaerolineae bacterium]PWB52343.1 MAG: hypothetical protein C3F13_11300 [Anaerolineales bacterium]